MDFESADPSLLEPATATAQPEEPLRKRPSIPPSEGNSTPMEVTTGSETSPAEVEPLMEGSETGGRGAPATGDGNAAASESSQRSPPLLCLRMHLDVCAEQVHATSGLLSTHLRHLAASAPSSSSTGASLSPEHRLRPGMPKLSDSGLDDIEQVLMSALDASGTISLRSRVSVLVVLMTRLTLADHRALVMHVLAHATSRACMSEFIKLEGLRIIRRWIVAAITADSNDELLALVRLLKRLPVDMNAIVRSGMGDLLRSLIKHASSKHDTTELYSETRELRAMMKDKALTSATVGEKTNSIDSDFHASLSPQVGALYAMLEEMRTRFPDLFGPEYAEVRVAVASAPSMDSVDVQHVVEKEQASPVKSASKPVEKPEAKVASKPAAAVTSRSLPSVPVAATAKTKPSLTIDAKPSVSAMPMASLSPALSSAVSPSAATQANREREKEIEEEDLPEIVPFNVSAVLQRSRPPPSTEVTDVAVAGSKSPSVSASMHESILRKDSKTSEKKVVWRDTVRGKTLVDVREYEIEGHFSSNLGAYRSNKSHNKDMNKKEAMMEREERANKARLDQVSGAEYEQANDLQSARLNETSNAREWFYTAPYADDYEDSFYSSELWAESSSSGGGVDFPPSSLCGLEPSIQQERVDYPSLYESKCTDNVVDEKKLSKPSSEEVRAIDSHKRVLDAYQAAAGYTEYAPKRQAVASSTVDQQSQKPSISIRATPGPIGSSAGAHRAMNGRGMDRDGGRGMDRDGGRGMDRDGGRGRGRGGGRGGGREFIADNGGRGESGAGERRTDSWKLKADCYFFARGECTRGTQCRFKHPS